MKKVVAAAAVFLFALLLVNYFPLFKAARETSESLGEIKPIVLSGETLFVSDFHLKKLSDVDMNFQVDNLVIVGDLFNYESEYLRIGEGRKDTFEKITDKMIKPLPDKKVKVYYISSSRFSHDSLMPVFDLYLENVEVHSVGKLAKFTIGNENIIALHGDQYNLTGFVPCAVSYFSNLAGKPLFLDDIFKKAAGISRDTWFITGHSHIPALDLKNKNANCGSRTGIPFGLERIFKVPTRTGILFDGANVNLVAY